MDLIETLETRVTASNKCNFKSFFFIINLAELYELN